MTSPIIINFGCEEFKRSIQGTSDDRRKTLFIERRVEKFETLYCFSFNIIYRNLKSFFRGNQDDRTIEERIFLKLEVLESSLTRRK